VLPSVAEKMQFLRRLKVLARKAKEMDEKTALE
jgi:hypothetical protein